MAPELGLVGSVYCIFFTVFQTLTPICVEGAQVYAYTDSRVQHSILRQFCRPDAVLPNLFVGTITYKSLDEAFNRGLDAETIVNYLEQHAHSKRVASAGGRVPTAVKEQIKLWERAMNRVQAAEVAAFHSFEVTLHRTALPHACQAPKTCAWPTGPVQRISTRGNLSEVVH